MHLSLTTTTSTSMLLNNARILMFEVYIYPRWILDKSDIKISKREGAKIVRDLLYQQVQHFPQIACFHLASVQLQHQSKYEM